MPGFAVDPDGAISLDWTASRYRVVSASLEPNGQLAFAWVNGADRGYGVATFDGQQVPECLIDLIALIAPTRNASLWAA